MGEIGRVGGWSALCKTFSWFDDNILYSFYYVLLSGPGFTTK